MNDDGVGGNTGFVQNVSGGFPRLSETFCGVLFHDFVRHIQVLVLLTWSTLLSWHTVTEHCTNQYVIWHLMYTL